MLSTTLCDFTFGIKLHEIVIVVFLFLLFLMKTEVCSYSGRKIHPGVGSRTVRADGKIFVFDSHKTLAHYQHRWNPRKHGWTLAYRKDHKKEAEITVGKRARRKVVKVQRAVVGASVEEILRRQRESKEERVAQREKAVRSAKEAKEAKMAKKAQKAAQQAQSGKPLKTRR
ncbi:hypothetical protein P9112_003513 [Eukaryota sp. TZLM1-RC]